jgi:GNAT superfamily N-acetyltransferase
MVPSNHEIRLASNLDVEDIVSFFRKEQGFFLADEQTHTSYVREYLECKNRYAIVAISESPSHEQHKSVIIGFAVIDIIQRPRGGQFAYLGEVFVLSTFRNNGIATQIIKLACIQAAKLQCHRIVLHCRKSTANIYERIGFNEWDAGYKMDVNLTSNHDCLNL